MPCEAALQTTKVYPSAGALATASAARVPPAPSRFSTVIAWPQSSLSLAATMRPVMSTPPPGLNPTKRRSGLAGKGWAAAGPTRTSERANSARARMAGPASIEADDLHPVRALAGRDLADRHEAAVRLNDRIRGDRFRFLAGDDHEAPRGIDAEAARLLLGGSAAEVSEVAGSGVDAEGADRAAGALRGVQEFPVWRQVQVGGPDVVVGIASRRRPRTAGTELAVRRQRGCGAHLLERPGLAVQGQGRHRRRELVEEVDEAVVGRGDQVTRAAAGLHLRHGRRVGGEPAALLVEQELEHLVGAEVRHEDEAVGEDE